MVGKFLGRVVIFTALATLACSCRNGARVEIIQANGHVLFHVAQSATDKKQCVEDLSVYPTTPEDAKPLWNIATADHAICLSDFTYGIVPKGFDASGAPAPLVKGTRYRVDASGTGFLGGNSFVYRAKDDQVR